MAGPRNILITGGTSGIGLALADRLSKRHRVLVTGRKLTPVLETLIKDRPDLEFLALDQNDPEKMVDLLVARLRDRQWDKIDNAVLNAGIGFVGDPIQEMPDRQHQTITVNLSANIQLAHSLFPYLSKGNGKLTFIGSTARKGAKNFASYAASKAGLHGFARALKEEWRGKVAVQILHPGPTKTDMHEKAGLKLGAVRLLFASPEAVAHMIENAMARNRFSVKVTNFQYWGGNHILGRGLR